MKKTTRSQLLLILTNELMLAIEENYTKYRINEIKEHRKPGTKQDMIRSILTAQFAKVE